MKTRLDHSRDVWFVLAAVVLLLIAGVSQYFFREMVGF
jgi:hypothetical protein